MVETMCDSKMKIAVFPGTFDPATNGHLDIIRRGAALFDELVIGVGINPDKATLLPHADRIEMLKEITKEMPTVRVQPFSDLTVAHAAELGAAVILRGLRDDSDYQYESRMALTNRSIAGIETLFLASSAEHSYISSTLIRQIASMGGDVSNLVPPEVMKYLPR